MSTTVKVNKLLEKLTETHYNILAEVEELENYGDDCTCNGKGYVYVFHGEFAEIINVCTECGGIKTL